MNILDSFTVAEMLKRPLFQKAKVIAGQGGLNRAVRWVHVLEILDGSSYVKGGELVLMTGVGLGEEKELKLDYVRELVESKVAALSIEMIHQFVVIPEAVKRFADERQFPIIIFEEPVSFVEITQDIHTWLIARHQDQLLSLERISTQFLQLTLQPQGLRKILQLLHKETGFVVWIEDYLGKTFIYPETEKPIKKNTLRRPITVLEVNIGELYIKTTRKLTEYLNLIIDRVMIAIAQEYLRQFLSEEWELEEGKRWMVDLVGGKRGEVPSSLLGVFEKRKNCVLCALSQDEWTFADESGLGRVFLVQLIRMMQHVFEQKGIKVWVAPVENRLAIILAEQQTFAADPFIARVDKGFDMLFAQFRRLHPRLTTRWKVGVSHRLDHLDRMAKAWEEACLALSMDEVPQDDLQGDEEGSAVMGTHTLIHYEKLRAWQLFLHMDTAAVQSFVDLHLGPLLQYDARNKTNLVRTLEVYFQTGLQKQQTAKSLFIHRQTLYYRLEQIAAMLGDDWEAPARRLALETAVSGYRFLSARQKKRDW
ncbi:purine catabolism regulator [Laceyella sediminis]|uniref:Purine catabolism regulator n=1 Tax=Laceyella sediminis TaxID=573074 RepID=A0ABX5EM20_9BACL|nr:PucR family transcriptional regulator ligand-binding domain-containing protein [Laceyella sediminis]PRZ12040.1 purine catabolism regulator [Laceyella sediminis]